MKRLSYIWMLSVLLVSSVSWAQEGKNQKEGSMVSLDFHDVDIQDVAKSISEITGRNFVLDDRVRGKITIISPSALSVKDAYQTFLSALEMKNLCAVDIGKVTKIIPLRECKGTNTKVLGESDEGRASGDEVVTELIRLDNISVNEARQALNPLVSKTGSIVAYGPSKTLMITDTKVNIDRLKRILQMLDRPGAKSTVEFIPLKNADSNEVAQKLKAIFEAQKKGAGGFRRRSDDVEAGEEVTSIMPDARTNSLIVVATREGLTKILELLDSIDRKVAAGDVKGRFHVRYIQHADAGELAQILSNLIGGKSGSSSKQASAKKSGSDAKKSSSSTALPWEDTGSGLGSSGGGTSEKSESSVAASGNGGGMFEDEVRVVSDPGTNSLLITASPADYQSLSGVIDQLDISRPQVFVEALIMEVSLDKLVDVDVNGHTAAAAGMLRMLGASNPGGTLSTMALGAGDPKMAAGGIAQQKGLLLGGISSKTFSIGGITLPFDGFTFKALQTDRIINVLSAPTILTTDNKKASIVVGDKVQVKKSSYSAIQGGAPVTNYEPENVGIQLDVTPHINEGDEVTLEIEQKIGEINRSDSDLTEGRVSTSERVAKTTVVAQNAQTIVIGGLIKEKDEKTISKVPLFGDIPIVGYLFRKTNTVKERKNLLLFLTPHVIHGPEDLSRVSVTKNMQRRAFNKKHGVRESPGLYDYELDKGLNMAPAPPRVKQEKKRFDYDKPADNDEPAASGSEEEVTISKRRTNGSKTQLTSSEYNAIGAQAATDEMPRRRSKPAASPSSPFADVRPPSSSN